METLQAMMEPPEDKPLSIEDQILQYRLARKQVLLAAVSAFRKPVVNARKTMQVPLYA